MYVGFGPILIPFFLIVANLLHMEVCPIEAPCVDNEWHWRFVTGFSNQVLKYRVSLRLRLMSICDEKVVVIDILLKSVIFQHF